MATGEVNRAEWAKIVRALLTERTKSKKAPLARLISKDPKTIDNWLAGSVKVSEESIRSVAELTGHSAMEWLIQVGYYQLGELPYQPTEEEIDEEQRQVLESDLPADQKAAILEQLESMRADDERLIVEQRERDRQRRMRELAWRIEQARRTA
ncbi:hypothetical protein ACIBF5_09695 [Micromonospora sp. NPDC050417]|uniref:hypothetical protein n=1 Tax=Micromonospora sp. NPDC050417 TaxID=3364280 RepID=UPI00379C7862